MRYLPGAARPRREAVELRFRQARRAQPVPRRAAQRGVRAARSRRRTRKFGGRVSRRGAARQGRAGTPSAIVQRYVKRDGSRRLPARCSSRSRTTRASSTACFAQYKPHDDRHPEEGRQERPLLLVLRAEEPDDHALPVRPRARWSGCANRSEAPDRTSSASTSSAPHPGRARHPGPGRSTSRRYRRGRARRGRSRGACADTRPPRRGRRAHSGGARAHAVAGPAHGLDEGVHGRARRIVLHHDDALAQAHVDPGHAAAELASALSMWRTQDGQLIPSTWSMVSFMASSFRRPTGRSSRETQPSGLITPRRSRCVPSRVARGRVARRGAAGLRWTP